MPPIIAITTYPQNDKGRYELPGDYVAAVRRAGGLVWLVPPGEKDLDGVLERVDGVVLAGGGDVDPSCFGAASHPTIYLTDDARDTMEIELARRVLATGMPTLAICRGLQVVNIAAGGDLHVHLPDVVGETVAHRLPPREPTTHPVEVEDGSLVAAAMGATEVDPVSWHHQAVRTLGEGLRPVGWAADGTVEAVEHDTHPWLAAVQWHPEMSADTDPTQQALFDALVNRAEDA